MLQALTVTRRPGTFTVVHLGRPVPIGDGVEAVLHEPEGFTVVATVEAARRHGWTSHFEACWLTVDLHSALHAVGLTAALSGALSRRGIACNVLAGYHHDHLLVPVAAADEALACLAELRRPDPGAGDHLTG